MSKKIKITFVLNNLEGGGAERILTNIVNSLDREKFIPNIFLFEKQGVYLNYLNEDVQVECGVNKFYKSKNKILNSVGYVKKHVQINTIILNKLCSFAKDSDVVVGFLEGVPTYITSKMSKKNKNKKYISWIHSNLIDYFPDKHIKLSRKYYKNIDKVFCVSKECEKIALYLFPDLKNKIETIYNPICINEIIDKANVESSDINLPKGKKIIAIGRLVYNKGFDVLIKAFKKVIEKEDCTLIILGEGEEKKSIENLILELDIKEKVIMPGFVDNPYKYLKKSDLFVLSSKFEGLPTVLIEALALDKKIVATKCSGVSEILNDGEFGYLSEIDNVEDLANNILKALADETYINRVEQAMSFDTSNIIKILENKIIN
ncbi:glycosyltransferase [Clostridium tarantellae]|uniref:Glycosyltransferase n=1 Tax=Clostridium tarantellae TaxID=39493 RepID=A0A6I1MQ02_9CLOT|nr:glycosyltransferase [Clostridium tarantellae]MPQ44207.1 glycosyltransferase [Clostridium tarantellae]